MNRDFIFSRTPLESKRPKSIMTLANKITICRILLIPVIVILLIFHQRLSAFFLLLISILTDLFDGLAARLRKEHTPLGAFLDPLADKLLLSATYLTLAYSGVVEIWVFVIVFSRDVLIVLGWMIIYILTSSSAITPRFLGKTTTVIQSVAALLFVLGVPPQLKSILIWALILFTIASVFDYIFLGDRNLRQ